ncbi:MAG: hypothetical protein L0Z50_42190 [Verrucomicrobiales bacterium]|nr:hypothetical protein [Verrucomicrobiales bacterium]
MTGCAPRFARLSPSATFDLNPSPGPDEASLSIDNYSYTLTGRGTFNAVPNVEFTAYFNGKGEPNYFRAQIPDSSSPGNLNIDALAAGPDWRQLLVPDIFREKFVLSSWTAEFNTDKHRPSKLALRFRVAGQFTPVDGLDLAMKEITVGYEIENPLAPLNNPGEPDYERKISGLLSAALDIFGTETNLSSNLVTQWDEWKLSTENYDVNKALPELWKQLHGDDLVPWPSFMDHFSLSKLQVDLYPAGQLDLTAWTNPLGNLQVILKRSLGEKPAPLSTQLASGYAATPAIGSARLSTQLSGGHAATPAGSSPPAQTKSALDLLLGYSCPRILSFPGRSRSSTAFGRPMRELSSQRSRSRSIAIVLTNDLPLSFSMAAGCLSSGRDPLVRATRPLQAHREKEALWLAGRGSQWEFDRVEKLHSFRAHAERVNTVPSAILYDVFRQVKTGENGPECQPGKLRKVFSRFGQHAAEFVHIVELRTAPRRHDDPAIAARVDVVKLSQLRGIMRVPHAHSWSGENFAFPSLYGEDFPPEAWDVRRHDVLHERTHFLRDLSPLLLRLNAPLAHLHDILPQFRDKGCQQILESIDAFFDVLIRH